MRVLVVTQYFWPEYFRVNDLVNSLLKNKHSVDVLTAIPNYPTGQTFNNFKLNKKKFSNFHGAQIFRVPIITRGQGSRIRLFLNYLSFIISAVLLGFFLLRKKKYDLVFCFGTSPITSAIPAIFFAKIKGCASILWVLDLWPDILKELGIIKNFIIYALLKKITEKIYKNFSYILAQSQSFKKTLNSYNKNVEYFPAWPEKLKKKKNKSFLQVIKKFKNDITFKIVFTGNIGEAQNLKNIVIAAEKIKNNNQIKLIIVGFGRELQNLKTYCEEKKIFNIIFVGSVRPEVVYAYHKIADILLISLLPGEAISATIPGKFSTYLKAKKYILGFIDGETKELINRLSVGETIPPNDPVALAKKIIYLQKKFYKKKKFIKKNKVLENFLENEFNKNLILANFNKFILNIFGSYLKFKLIKNPINIPFNKNFSLSGLNLAFIGYLAQGKIKLREHIFLWPDGIFHKRFYNIKSRKISGRALIQTMILPKFIKNIYILGNLSGVAKKYVEKNFKKNVIHINLPYGSPEYIFKSIKKSFYKEDVILLTLPTPTQELVSELIVKKNKHYKIICLGGALEMASGNDIPVPIFLENLGLEFIWRLRSETSRRLKRLIITFVHYIGGELSFKYKLIRSTVFD